MKKNDEIAITVKDLHVYYRDMNRFSLKKVGVKGKGSGKIFKAVKGVSFENLLQLIKVKYYYHVN